MIKLPEGVTIHAGGREWRGEIPAALCPKKYHPSTVPAPEKKKDESAGAR